MTTPIRFSPTICGSPAERRSGGSDYARGDQVSFDARVSRYEKGHRGRRAEELGEYWSETDYRLERPTKASRI